MQVDGWWFNLGITFNVINTDFDGTKWPIDRPWMVIDKSNGPNRDNLYVTTFNLNRNNPRYNPYLSVSEDSGSTFRTRYLDTTGWLAGSINPLPMCSPTISSSGVFYGAFPSYVLTQSFYAQSFLVKSTNGGKSLSHSKLMTFPPATFTSDSLAKKSGLLISNPADSNHLAFIFLSAATHGDMDVFIIESFNSGDDWSTPIRLNDDSISNNRMQDMLWGDFDRDGDLVVSWRDRRNGSDSSYKTSAEIWATYRNRDSAQFGPNFQITSQSVEHDSVLERAGNDFMCIKIQDDTLNATWGDTRDGKLNIWFQRLSTNGSVLSTTQISSESSIPLSIYPNPTTSTLTITGQSIESIKIYSIEGKHLWSPNQELGSNHMSIDIGELPKGAFYIEVKTESGEYIKRVLKQ